MQVYENFIFTILYQSLISWAVPLNCTFPNWHNPQLANPQICLNTNYIQMTFWLQIFEKKIHFEVIRGHFRSKILVSGRIYNYEIHIQIKTDFSDRAAYENWGSLCWKSFIFSRTSFDSPFVAFHRRRLSGPGSKSFKIRILFFALILPNFQIFFLI